MRDHTPNTRVTARRMNRVIGGLTSMRSRLEGVSNVVAALRAGIGTVGMSSECSALLALSAPLADALTSETGAVADSAALQAAASQGSRLPAASKSSRGLLIDTNIGHTPHFSWLPSERGAQKELPHDLRVFVGAQQLRLIVVKLDLQQPAFAVRIAVDHGRVVRHVTVHILDRTRHGAD